MQKWENQEPIKCLATNSTQYAINKHINPVGIMIHSSGIKTPYLKTYVQPSKSDSKYDILMSLIGYNFNNNDWNHIHRSYNYHYFIGLLNNNDIAIVETHPVDMQVWNDNYIHLCICEKDDDPAYAAEVLLKLQLFCKDICNEYNWDSSHIIDCSEYYPFRPDASCWLSQYGYNIRDIKTLCGDC